jgi:RHS repeat-associated protein
VPRAALLALTLVALIAMPSRAADSGPSSIPGRTKAAALRPSRPDVAVRDVAYDAFGLLLATSGSSSNRFRYVGEQEDEHVGGYYLRARTYVPANGRFLNEDFLEDIDSHKYAYAAGDPVNRTDPSGLFSIIENVQVASIVATLRIMTIAQAHPVIAFTVITLSGVLLPDSVLDSIEKSGTPLGKLAQLGKAEKGAVKALKELTGSPQTMKTIEEAGGSITRRLIGIFSQQKGKTFEDFVNAILNKAGAIIQREPVFTKEGAFKGLREAVQPKEGWRVADFLFDYVTKEGTAIRWLVEVKSGFLKSLSAREAAQLKTLADAAAQDGRKLVYFLLREPPPGVRKQLEEAGATVISFLKD